MKIHNTTCNQFRHTCTMWGIHKDTLKAAYWVLVIGMFIIAILAWAKVGWDYEMSLRHPQHLISPLSMTAYAETIDAGNSAQPKFPLADLSEREKNIEIIKKIWGRNSGIALKISLCESGYRSEAINNNTNGTQDQGVFQINTVHQMPYMFNPVANISYAYSMFLAQGTNPWYSSKHCWNN